MAKVVKGAAKRPRSMRKRQERACLRCDQMISSAGPHNRLCEACQEALASVSAPEEGYSLVS